MLLPGGNLNNTSLLVRSYIFTRLHSHGCALRPLFAMASRGGNLRQIRALIFGASPSGDRREWKSGRASASGRRNIRDRQSFHVPSSGSTGRCCQPAITSGLPRAPQGRIHPVLPTAPDHVGPVSPLWPTGIDASVAPRAESTGSGTRLLPTDKRGTPGFHELPRSRGISGPCAVACLQVYVRLVTGHELSISRGPRETTLQ